MNINFFFEKHFNNNHKDQTVVKQHVYSKKSWNKAENPHSLFNFLRK